MPLRIIKRTLNVHRLESIDGCGSDLTFKISAGRDTKAGTTERYELTLECCRWSVTQLLDGLKLMHVRDRERIQRELARIDQEANALRGPP
jgi:hypothetical protein